MQSSGSTDVDFRTSSEVPQAGRAESYVSAVLVVVPTALLMARWRGGPLDALLERNLGVPSGVTQTVLLACVATAFLLTRRTRHISAFDRMVNGGATFVLIAVFVAVLVSLLSHI